jgi:hypothetical protein
MNRTMTAPAPQLNAIGGKHPKCIFISNLDVTLGEVTEKDIKNVGRG